MARFSTLYSYLKQIKIILLLSSCLSCWQTGTAKFWKSLDGGEKKGMKGERWRERKKGIREGKKNCTQRKVLGLPNWTYTLDHMGLKMQLASNASSASESIAHGMTLFQDTPIFLFPASQGLNADECKTQGSLVHFMHHCSLGFWFIKPGFCGAQKVSCDLRTVFSNRGWFDWSVLDNDPQTLGFWTTKVCVLFMLFACCKNTVASTGPHSGTLAAGEMGTWRVPYCPLQIYICK